MKKIITISLLVVSLITGKAQNFDKNDIAVFSFNVNVSETLGVLGNQEMFDSIYNGVVTVLKDSAGIAFKPIDFLQGRVLYFSGFPLGTAKKAAASNLCHNYAKINVTIEPVGVISSSSTSSLIKVDGLKTTKKKTTTKIKVAVSLVVYNDKAEKVKELTGKAFSKDKVVVDSKTLAIGDFSTIYNAVNNENFETFETVLFQALVELAKTSR